MMRRLCQIGLTSLFTCTAAVTLTAGTTNTPQLSEANLGVVSEAFGHMIGRNLNSPGIEFDVERVIEGIRNAKAGKESPLSDKEYEEFMALIQQRAFHKLADDNLREAERILQENQKDNSIVEINPGKLQYRILVEGDGPEVTPTSSPVLHYKGSYADGSVFGSSEETGGPIAIPLNQTIPGFSRGVLGMREGEKRQIIIHPDLGYGTSGHLPPNSLLIFEVDLVRADQNALPEASETTESPATETDDAAEAEPSPSETVAEAPKTSLTAQDESESTEHSAMHRTALVETSEGGTANSERATAAPSESTEETAEPEAPTPDAPAPSCA